MATDIAVGKVETSEGGVWAVRADGSRVELQAGDQVFQGDLLETAENGAVGVTFSDGSAFSLGGSGEMSIDQLVYDPLSQTGESFFSVVQGTFSFVSGAILNAAGGGCHDEDCGLTDFGREVVAELEARPIVLDLAHSSQQVARDVIAMTDMPVIVSHTGLHSHCEVVRNYPDDLMRDIAATGGVIGIGYWEDVTCDDSPEGIAKTVRAAIDAVGEDAVTLGSDFDGAVTTSFDTSELAALTQAMLDEGLTEAQIRKVAGENMIRVLRARLD
mgnify:CR=1 FL=1